MFLGTQVREYIDQLTRQGIGKEDWSEMLGLSYFVHRSFSWLVMILLGILFISIRKQKVQNYTVDIHSFSNRLISGV